MKALSKKEMKDLGFMDNGGGKYTHFLSKDSHATISFGKEGVQVILTSFDDIPGFDNGRAKRSISFLLPHTDTKPVITRLAEHREVMKREKEEEQIKWWVANKKLTIRYPALGHYKEYSIGFSLSDLFTNTFMFMSTDTPGRPTSFKTKRFHFLGLTFTSHMVKHSTYEDDI